MSVVERIESFYIEPMFNTVKVTVIDQGKVIEILLSPAKTLKLVNILLRALTKMKSIERRETIELYREDIADQLSKLDEIAMVIKRKLAEQEDRSR